MKEVIKILNNIEKYYALSEEYSLDCFRTKGSKSIGVGFKIGGYHIDALNNHLSSIPAQGVYKDGTSSIYNFPGHSYDTVMSILDERKEKLKVGDGLPSVTGIDDKGNIIRINAIKVHDDYKTYKSEEETRIKKQIALEVLNSMTSQNRNQESKEFKDIVIKLLKLEFFKNIYNKGYSEYIVVGDSVFMEGLNALKVVSHDIFKKVYKLMVKGDIEGMRNFIKKESGESNTVLVNHDSLFMERAQGYNTYLRSMKDLYENGNDNNIDIDEYIRVYNSIANELGYDTILYMVLGSDGYFDISFGNMHTRDYAPHLRIGSILQTLMKSFRYSHGKFYYYTSGSKKQHGIYLHNGGNSKLLKSNGNIVLIGDALELSNDQYIKRMKGVLIKEIDSMESGKQQLINRVASIMKGGNGEELDKIMKQIEIILELDCVKDVKYQDNKIHIRTNPIYINKYYDHIQYDYDTLIGEFVITIGIGSSSVHVHRENHVGTVHPHVGSGGSFCVGDFGNTMYNAARSYDYVTCVLYTIEHITTYNRSSPYVKLSEYIQRHHAHITKVSVDNSVPSRRPLTGFSKNTRGSDFQGLITRRTGYGGVTINGETIPLDTDLTISGDITINGLMPSGVFIDEAVF